MFIVTVICGIDWQTNGNLLACCGYKAVKIYDRRQRAVVRSIEDQNYHTGNTMVFG